MRGSGGCARGSRLLAFFLLSPRNRVPSTIKDGRKENASSHGSLLPFLLAVWTYAASGPVRALDNSARRDARAADRPSSERSSSVGATAPRVLRLDAREKDAPRGAWNSDVPAVVILSRQRRSSTAVS